MKAPSDPPSDASPSSLRRAANAKRYRDRYNRGQAVYRVTAHAGRLIRFLIREGRLADGEAHDRSEIEQALTLLIDDAARK